MRLRVDHTTLFEYDSLIYETATELRLHPIDDHDSLQRCLSFNLTVEPRANIFQYTDFYGNIVHHFNILHSHKRIEITTSSIVDSGNGHTDSKTDEEIFLQDFLGESHYIQFDKGTRKFATAFKGLKDNEEIATEVCRTINSTFIYEPGVTDVHSTSPVVMALGRGVCQDFAHVMISTCRYLGVPTRYVSGYLYGGVASEENDEASHAWCEVYCGPEKGWQGFDPTHKTLFVDERYIKIGAGRDYNDIPPVRGTYKGNAKENLKVTVRVKSLKPDTL